jgi:hypothetical protein
MTASAEDQAILKIAQRVLKLETLDTRRSDSLDFSDQAVWQIRAALEAAYDAGYRAAQNELRDGSGIGINR